MATLENFKLNGVQLSALWYNGLWNIGGKRGLALLEDDRWIVVERGIFGWDIISREGHTKEYLITEDSEWIMAFDKIVGGLEPTWSRRHCTCGAHAVYGKSWDSHGPTCWLSEPYYSPAVPKNNDGRECCWKCGEPTIQKVCWTSFSNLCTNKNCGWYNR